MLIRAALYATIKTCTRQAWQVQDG